MRKTRKRDYVIPNILVLEGLYADTADIVNDAGGCGIEASPWDFASVSQKLKSGRINGILLTGGSDVNPARYGQKPCYFTQHPDNARDFTELAAMRYAREHKIPVLGICRGSQVMCVSQGGTLTQDIRLYLEPLHTHGSTDHEVYVTKGARTLPRACQGSTMQVLSLHHQCVDNPGRGMRIAARASDGVPEAIESVDGLMLGVQFHPEMYAYRDEQAFSIFRWLVETAARQMGGKAYAASFRDAQDRYSAAISSAYSAWRHDSDDTSRTASTWDAIAEAEAEVEAGQSAANPGGPAKQPGKHRKAGEPAIPSMRERAESLSTREMVNLIENSTGYPVTVLDAHGNEIAPDGSIIDPEVSQLEERLHTCPVCHIRFDCIEDCDDHKKFVHPTAAEPLGPLSEKPPRALLGPGPRVIDPDSNDHNYSCDLELQKKIEERFAERYPELEPPPGHPAWDEATCEDVERWIKMKIAIENGFDVQDWEDIDI